MVTQDHHRLVAQVGYQPSLLIHVQRNPFIGVVRHLAIKLHGHLVERQQPTFQRRHRTTCPGVGVQHTTGILAGSMDGAVDDETGRVDRVRRRFHWPALQVDLHQAGGRDLIEQQAVRVDQEVVLRPRQAQGNMGEDQVAHTEMGD
ncbi:hypothetical protein D3C72_581650 [compost metagenome]